jgi:alpha-1,3-glucosyltransferase
VGEVRFALLPQVAPWVAAACVGAALIPCLAATWRDPAPARFARAVAYANLCGFMFGWHVHEKAILMVSLCWNVKYAHMLAIWTVVAPAPRRSQPIIQCAYMCGTHLSNMLPFFCTVLCLLIQ